MSDNDAQVKGLGAGDMEWVKDFELAAADGTTYFKVAKADGALTLGGSGALGLDDAVVINDSGADKDFRVEGDTEANLLFTDASTDRVGIGTATPGSKLEVVGTITSDGADLDGAVTINEAGADVDFRVEGSGEANALFVDGANGNVGIGTTSPGSELHILDTAADTNAADITITKNRGGAALTTGDNVGFVTFTGHDGTDALTRAARIIAKSEGAIATNRIPTSLSFWTAKGAADDDLTEKVRITPAGNVGIGETSPSGKLEVSVADAGNVTGLVVDQNDVTNNPTALSIENAGTGTCLSITGAGLGIDMSSFSVDEPLLKAPADAITSLGTVSHQIAVDIGGTVFYIPAYTTGS